MTFRSRPDSARAWDANRFFPKTGRRCYFLDNFVSNTAPFQSLVRDRPPRPHACSPPISLVVSVGRIEAHFGRFLLLEEPKVHGLPLIYLLVHIENYLPICFFHSRFYRDPNFQQFLCYIVCIYRGNHFLIVWREPSPPHNFFGVVKIAYFKYFRKTFADKLSNPTCGIRNRANKNRPKLSKTENQYSFYPSS